MAELEDFFDERIRKQTKKEEQRLVEEEERAQEEEKITKEAGRRKIGHRKKRPTKKS